MMTKREIMMSKRVIGYIRVSTSHQTESGLGLADQRSKIEAYCELYDLELVDIIADEGVSGRSMKGRDGLQSIIDRSEAGDFDGVVIAKLDRLTRSLPDLHHLLNGLLSAVELHSVNEKIDTSSSTGRLILNVMTSISSWEAEVAGERTSWALQEKKKQAQKTENTEAKKAGRKAKKVKVNGRAPFGYEWVDGVLTRNEIEQEIISLLVELKEAGCTYAQLGDELTKLGYLTSKGTPYQRTAIRRIILRAHEESA